MLARVVPLRAHRASRDPEALSRPGADLLGVPGAARLCGAARERRPPPGGRAAPLLAAAERLEQAVGPVEIVFGHNDLLAANLIDDGSRLWLVDWEYGGFNSPLFDLGGLASNNELSPALEERLLELYFEAPATDDLRRRYHAMKCASLLREAMWSMVSEIHLTIDFDYQAYTAENLDRFERAYADPGMKRAAKWK